MGFQIVLRFNYIVHQFCCTISLNRVDLFGMFKQVAYKYNDKDEAIYQNEERLSVKPQRLICLIMCFIHAVITPHTYTLSLLSHIR